VEGGSSSEEEAIRRVRVGRTEKTLEEEGRKCSEREWRERDMKEWEYRLERCKDRLEKS
jgi:hypothetical protein